jgi:hypothetical protein
LPPDYAARAADGDYFRSRRFALHLLRSAVTTTIALLAANVAMAGRPITYAGSTTVMAEYGEGTMQEAQVFYAPHSFLSFGLGHMRLDGHGLNQGDEITYARVNFLARRWNREASQANAFVWGGAGKTQSTIWVPPGEAPPAGEHDHGGGGVVATEGYRHTITGNGWNAGAQLDFETRHFYSMIKTDAFRSGVLSHRVDTLQLGVSPFKHEADTLSTWLVVSGTRHDGEYHESTEWALLLRFFRKRVWFEAGATTEGQLRASAMFSL